MSTTLLNALIDPPYFSKSTSGITYSTYLLCGLMGSFDDSYSLRAEKHEGNLLSTLLFPFIMLQVHIVVIDNNDNPPVFSQSTYDVTISEDTPPDTEVLQVFASDRDEHHQLTYSLQSSIDPSSISLFRISPTLGSIYTAQRLDHEACSQHILTVVVSVCPALCSWILYAKYEIFLAVSSRTNQFHLRRSNNSYSNTVYL